MPFLKHGMGGDCDGQPDDERAEDEPSHGVSGKWIRERILNGKTNKGSVALHNDGVRLATEAADKRVGAPKNRMEERQWSKRDIQVGATFERGRKEAAKGHQLSGGSEDHGVSSAWIHERVRNSKPKGSARTLDAINKNADGIGRMPYKAMGGDHHQKRQVFESTLRDRHARERETELSKHSRLKKRG